MIIRRWLMRYKWTRLYFFYREYRERCNAVAFQFEKRLSFYSWYKLTAEWFSLYHLDSEQKTTPDQKQHMDELQDILAVQPCKPIQEELDRRLDAIRDEYRFLTPDEWLDFAAWVSQWRKAHLKSEGEG